MNRQRGKVLRLICLMKSSPNAKRLAAKRTQGIHPVSNRPFRSVLASQKIPSSTIRTFFFSFICAICVIENVWLCTCN